MGACAVDLMAENRFRIAAYLVENKIIDGVNLNEVIADLRNPGMSLQKGYSDSSAYLNDMGNKATYSFAFSNALKSQNWGPFNGVKDLIANRWANNGFEKLERMSETGGAKAVTQWAEGPGGRGFKDMASATGRNIMNWKPTADMYANAFKTTGNMAMTTGLATSLAGGSGGALYGGGVAAMVISEGAAKSNTIHAQSVPIVQSGLDASKSFDNRSFQSPTTQSSRLPSGVDVSFEAVNWDVGEWPFIEYYGVLYGIKSKKMFLTSEGVKENKDVK